jgi:rod shape-determining protein MreC
MKFVFARKAPWWFAILIILICTLIGMLLARYTPWGQRVVNEASVMVWPFQEMVAQPAAGVKHLSSDLQSRSALIQENQRLHAKMFLLQAQLQRFIALQKQNKQLKALLLSSQELDGKVLVAHLLAVDLNPALHQVIIDKGSHAHLYTGQPVVDAYGVMGQVVTITPKVSRVLLVTDTKSAIPVKDVRSGQRAVAVGSAGPMMKLINVTDTADIKPGDLMVTSGLGMQFPFGYPVGTVRKVVHTPSQNFADISLQPSAHLNKSSQVLLIWPRQQSLAQAAKSVLRAPLSHS